MKLLVVEDNHKLAQLLKEGLQHEAFIVDLCYDGDSALDHALSGDYAVVVLDRMLPGALDGTEVCRRIRGADKHTPVLMLTAKAQVKDRVEGLNSGADDYLVKPFAFEELLARIHSLLRRPHASVGAVLTAGNLTLNPITREVRRSGQRIQLTQKEYMLLEYLIRNKEMALSKQSIIDHVWDFDADILPGTLDVFILYLRKKIDKPFPASPPLIATVRGFGYKVS